MNEDLQEDEEKGEEAFVLPSDEQEFAMEPERILLKREVTTSYWVDPYTFRKVTLSYPG